MQGSKSLVTLAVTLAVVIVTLGSENDCEYNSCSDCIGDPGCVWCSNPNITLVAADTGGKLFHCICKASLNYDTFTEACKNAIVDPPTVLKITEDEELSKDPIVHLKPQRVSLEMRAGESTRIRVKYKHQANYPLDVYCLMDGSKSMTKWKTDLAELTDQLVDRLEDLSSNIQLGFGMFVDKPILPYTDINRWTGKNCNDCVETFSFKNILPVSDDRKTFQDKVHSAKTSTNIDVPEGVLEALVQVASCTDKVNWRTNQLKVVVVFTNGGFHVAGDGKLAGITAPNDRQCHLDDSGMYTHSEIQDYPSISELASVLDESHLYTTFAVTKEVVPLYTTLVRQLPQSDSSELTKDASNIVDIIAEFAKGVISTVELKQNSDEIPELTVEITSQCKGHEESANYTCTDMNPGDEAEFFINIKVNSCPKADVSQSATLVFTLAGYSDSTFIVDLKLMCRCECEQEEVIPNADECSNEGELRCGVCVCNKGFLGDKCQCVEGVSSSQINEEKCIHPNATNGLVCSGQGKCVCGLCECNVRENPNEKITGHYCQCTNFKNCPSTASGICSGNGQCICDRCECGAGWQGKACDCQMGNTNCRASPEADECSGQGKCVCNRCQCKEGYQGHICELCQNCEAKCVEHESCVHCLVFEGDDACKDSCSDYDITIVSDISKDYGQLCVGTDDDGCRYFYQFKHNDDAILVWADNKKDCAQQIKPWVVVGIVLGAVVVVGVLLLIAWKAITYLKDKKEFENFVKNKSMAVWSENENPLFAPATTTVRNPLFEETKRHN